MQVISLAFLLACSGNLHFSPQEIPTQQVETIPVLPTTNADVTRIYFIHNAESEYSVKDQNGTKFTSGRSPEISLSERGKSQAERLGDLLSSRIAEAVVFLPPAERAKETATPLISDTIDIGAYYEGLFEVGMGAWEGKPKDQLYKNEYQKWKDLSAVEKYATPKMALGESYKTAALRAMQDLEAILRSNSEKTILIISGENLLNALAIQWMNPLLSEDPGSDLPMLPMEKGDFFLVEVPRGQPIEQAEVKTLFHIGFGVAPKHSNSSQILSTENLNLIEQLIENLDQDTLVLFDVDQTLITPNDPILKPKYDKLLDDLMGGKKFITDESGKTRYIFREIIMHAPHSLIDPKSLILVQKLQAKGVPVIAFSAAPGGKIGEVNSFVDWRIDELQHFGFDFQSAFPNIQTLELPKDTDLEFPPIYKSGVLITSLHDKGPVLLNFFKESNWTPKKVVFIDDQMSNIRSVVESLEGRVQTLGIHYTGASLIPCPLENNAAQYQVDYFLKTGKWVSQAEAISAMIENNASLSP